MASAKNYDFAAEQKDAYMDEISAVVSQAGREGYDMNGAEIIWERAGAQWS